jgi:hypothetical protein
MGEGWAGRGGGTTATDARAWSSCREQASWEVEGRTAGHEGEQGQVQADEHANTEGEQGQVQADEHANTEGSTNQPKLSSDTPPLLHAHARTHSPSSMLPAVPCACARFQAQTVPRLALSPPSPAQHSSAHSRQ